MRGCGCLLIMLSVAVMLIFVAVPVLMELNTLPPLQQLYETVFCDAGETLTTERSQSWSSYDDTTGYSVNFYCETLREGRREVTGTILLVTIGAFTGLLVLGIIAVNLGGSVARVSPGATINMPAPGVGNLEQILDQFRVGQPTVVRSIFGTIPPKETPDTPVADTLKESLQALKDSYEAGLISKTEYDTARTRLLEDL